MKRLAQTAYDKRWFVLIGWIVGVVVIFGISNAVAGEHRTDFSLPGSESQSALDLLKAKGDNSRSSGFTGQIVFKADSGVTNPAVKSRMEKLFSDITSQVKGVDIGSPYDPAKSYQVSKDGKIAYAEVNFEKRPDKEYRPAADTIKDLHKGVKEEGLQVELGGDLFADQADPSSEGIGIIAAIIILLIAFGSVLAMGLPIATALFGIVTGTALIGITTRFLAVPEFTPLVAGMIGIGVGIDYSLLIVTRYRQALHDGLEPRDAVVQAIDTSGRSVLFAGTVVVISLLGIFTMNLDFMRSMAIGAVLAVAMTMLSALTLLPALLGFVGRNIDRFGLPHRASKAEHDVAQSFWYKWSRVIQHHPWPALVISTAILLVLAAPVFDIKLGFTDNGLRGTEQSPRRAYDMLAEGFGPGFNGPFLVVADTPNGQSDFTRLNAFRDAVAATPGVASVTPLAPIADGRVALFNIFPATGPREDATVDLVHKIRDEVRPSVLKDNDPKAYLAGLPPGVVDFSDFQAEKLPIFFAAVLVLSFILLMTVFHSVIVPLKAVIMNMLSIGASFGLTVAVFQWGIGRSLLGLQADGPFEAWAPMFLFSILFGLSMDYEVFLLTRVREEYDRTGDNGRAVADGLAATGRVISAAAAIMVCVFGAFILGDERAIKLMGFGLASAILIDATLVRLVLVPSAMELLGKANWWAPEWLVKRLPTIRVEASDHGTPAAPIGQYQRP